MFRSTDKFDFSDLGDSTDHISSSNHKSMLSEKGCRITVVTGFILTLLFLVLAALVGLIVHFTGPGRAITCSCNCAGDNNAGNTLPNVQVTTMNPPTTLNVLQECKNLASSGNTEVCGLCPLLITTEMPTAESATTTGIIQTTTEEAPKPVIDYRLPSSFRPYHYNIQIRTSFEGERETFNFNGTVKIFMESQIPSDNVTLHINLLNLTATPTFMSIDGVAGAPTYKNHTVDPERHFLVVYLDKSTTIGYNYTLELSFIGMLTDDLVGLYYSSYKSGNDTIHLAFTQLQATDARRVFPCFDEPALKATFNVSLERKKDNGLYTITNTPLVGQEDLSDGYVVDIYDTTVVMPTYLIAIAYVNFDNLTKTSTKGTLFSTYTRPEYINQSQYALDIGLELLEAFENYTNIQFMMPKLDNIAVPDYAFGGMENWGLITYYEPYLLYEENVTTTSLFVFISEIVAHEVAHMWFGNLVTMEWWDDTWLNEGFATFFSLFGLDMIKPELKYMDFFVTYIMHYTMEGDSYSGSAPIYRENINSPADIDNRFDSIIYEKGASILRMLWFILGPETFQYGLREYLTNKSYSSARHDDLWWHLTKRAAHDGRSSLDVKVIMDPWIKQQNYPVVHITKISGNLTVTQNRFLLGTNSENATRFAWNIPFTYTTKSALQFNQTWNDIKWIYENEKEKSFLDIEVKATDWVIGNIGEYGYYRVNYEQDNWDYLNMQLIEDHTVIPVINRAQIINDVWYLSKADLVSLETALNFLLYLNNETEYLPWFAAFDELGYIETMIQHKHAYLDFEKFFARLVRKRFEEMQLHLGDKRQFQTRLLDNRIYDRACRSYVGDCTTKSLAFFRAWKHYGTKIPPDIKDTVLCTAIRDGSLEDWDFLYQKYKTGPATDAALILYALGCSKRSSVLNRYLSFTKDKTEIRKGDVSRVILAVSRNLVGFNTAWKFTMENWQFFINNYSLPLTSQSQIINGITRALHTDFELSQLMHWKLGLTPSDSGILRIFDQAVERVLANQKWMNTYYSRVEKWLTDSV